MKVHNKKSKKITTIIVSIYLKTKINNKFHKIKKIKDKIVIIQVI
jgi:hypothetical protein